MEHEGVVVHLLRRPHAGVEALLAAMEGVVVITVVEGHLIFLAVQVELTVGDAVAITTNEGGKIRLGRIDDVLNVVVSLNDIGTLSVLIGNHDGNDCSTIVGDGHLIAETILEDKKICLVSVHSGLKVFALQATDITCFGCVRHIDQFLVIILMSLSHCIMQSNKIKIKKTSLYHENVLFVR